MTSSNSLSVLSGMAEKVTTGACADSFMMPDVFPPPPAPVLTPITEFNSANGTFPTGAPPCNTIRYMFFEASLYSLNVPMLDGFASK